jgi:hypothetical protein
VSHADGDDSWGREHGGGGSEEEDDAFLQRPFVRTHACNTHSTKNFAAPLL